ncbi:MAG: hypothetical protein OHK0039_20180 [Bacteroidia bacterium]
MMEELFVVPPGWLAAAQQVVAALQGRGQTLALAESCTGGLLAAVLSAVPGASAVFERGLCLYSNAAKSDLLGIDPALIASQGAVSAAVAAAMAAAVRQQAGTTTGLAITGIAGPGGGRDAKPIGLVYMALDDGGTSVRRYVFDGDRQQVRAQAVQAALDWLLTRSGS